MTLTVAQGDQTLTFTVPMSRMRAIAAQGGKQGLAQTGGNEAVPIAAAVLLMATGLMLIPAVRRRRG